jgi:hypothetical protein
MIESVANSITVSQHICKKWLYDESLVVVFFFLVSWGRVRQSPLGRRPLIGLLYQPRMIDDMEQSVE